MNRSQSLFPTQRPSGAALHGIYMGRVLSVNAASGTVRVHVEDGSRSIDAAVLAPRANNGRGWVWLPEEGDLVAVAFLAGAKARPIVLGCFFDRLDTLPNTQAGSATLYHQSGTKLQIDANGDLHLTHKSGSDLTTDASNHTVTHHGTTLQIQSNGDVVITHASGQKLLLSGTRVELDSASGLGKLSVDNGAVILSSGGTLQLNPNGTIVIAPGLGATVSLGGGTNAAVMNGDITGPAIGTGVPAHYHQIIGGSTKVTLA